MAQKKKDESENTEIAVIEITEELLREKLYEIRGMKVMLDADLAEIYGYETKAFNQQVKRNIVRFPEDMMFQLTDYELEYLRSQFVTANISSMARSNPYVFTEQGVYMLMTVKQLEENINNHQYRNLGINQLQGYMLEEWGAGTFNIDAVAADSAYRAEVLHSTAKDSVDVLIKNGGKDAAAYSAKSYADGAKSAIEQARLNPDTRQASYQGQGRLVPTDQLSDAQAEAHRQALRNQPIRPEVSEAYAETEHKLTDTITTDDGTKSRTATRKDLEQIAKESKQQDFKASEHGVTAESAIQTEYLLKQALKAGYTAAAVTVAVQLAPEIYKAIDYLIKHGELDIQQIKRMGTKGISAGAEGFLRGSVASSLKIMCDAGMLGEIFKGINPKVLGTLKEF